MQASLSLLRAALQVFWELQSPWAQPGPRGGRHTHRTRRHRHSSRRNPRRQGHQLKQNGKNDAASRGKGDHARAHTEIRRLVVLPMPRHFTRKCSGHFVALGWCSSHTSPAAYRVCKCIICLRLNDDTEAHPCMCGTGAVAAGGSGTGDGWTSIYSSADQQLHPLCGDRFSNEHLRLVCKVMRC